ncbi:hypothetical protein Ga0061063_0699 [Gulbenkiania indica]|uniref:Uncharacterized protein n=2 Tax=Gulbenkiania TaxID=397456 RepID=A0A0K6GT94_9NEIS|nr:hypothetical protein [Gulbenkiania indica]TCW31727.1 hypothetical protein EV669_10494 [Gulbenkiania mobilis]CUA81852.1 hypothetical protein Ga0061063_0699 [Gulbenkiania indica]
MLGRLFKLFVLSFLAYLVVSRLFSRGHRKTLREVFEAVAIGLLVSSVVFVGFYLAGQRL